MTEELEGVRGTLPPAEALPIAQVRPHGLPYRTIFEEYRERRGDAFDVLLQRWGTAAADAGPPPVGDARALLETALANVDRAYANLAERHRDLRAASGRVRGTRVLRKAAIESAHALVQASAGDCEKADRPLKRLLHLCESSALCLSGGGIRSASYCLGVLQGLAHFSLWTRDRMGMPPPGFLHRLDFLSTVSGGGYIGSWLMGWARRSSFSTAIYELGSTGKTAGDPEPDPVRHLRDYASFLAPRYGFTVDTATLVAIMLRNLFLNWVIFLPCLIAIILLPRLLAMVGYSLAAWVISFPGHADQTLMWIAASFIALAGLVAAYRASRPPTSSRGATSRFRSETIFLWVTMLAAWLIVDSWIAGWNNVPADYTYFNHIRVLWLILDLTIASIPMSIVRCMRPTPDGKSPYRVAGHIRWGRIAWSFVATILVGVVTAVVLELFAVHAGPWLYGNNDFPDPRFQVFAVPMVVLLLMAGSSFLSGLLSAVEYEEEREWWARAGGVFFIILLGWMGIEAISWYSGYFVTHDPGHSTLIWGSGTAFFGGAAAAAGKSAASSSGLKSVDLSQLSRAGRILAKNRLLAPVLSCVALICIFLLVGSLNELLLQLLSRTYPVPTLYATYSHIFYVGDVHFFSSAYDVAIPVLAGMALFLALLGNACINVNTFSLHGMYRMRLVRAFLGASNFGRDADRFTNFDTTDNISQSGLPRTDGAPIHVVNTALNLVDSRNQAWQQRKAESFTMTPLRCGSWRLGYAPTHIFGGIHGVTLGTAMAISGAAFNPNMGYNSSPLVTFVMTLFNARLGWWLPNPAWVLLSKLNPDGARRYLSNTGPTFALASIIAEALGKTDDRRKWIQLSDGGHFENLGLYEMVLRRCRHIVAVDAGADSKLQFEDLGNAIRKINIDLGIPITFAGDGPWPFSDEKTPSDRYCVVGKIEYHCADGADAPYGYLIYIKAHLIGHEPRDVSAYAAAHPCFPHETTANQFFNEAQFESYRKLGFHVIADMLSKASSNGVDDLLAAVFQYCGQTPF